MNKTHYERRSHEQGNYEIAPTYTGTIHEEPVVPVNPGAGEGPVSKS